MYTGICILISGSQFLHICFTDKYDINFRNKRTESKKDKGNYIRRRYRNNLFQYRLITMKFAQVKNPIIVQPISLCNHFYMGENIKWTHPRLLHSPKLVVIWLSVGYEIWPPIGCHRPFVIGWSKYRVGLLSAPLHYGLTPPAGIFTVFQPRWQPFCTALTTGKCLLLGLCKGSELIQSKSFILLNKKPCIPLGSMP